MNYPLHEFLIDLFQPRSALGYGELVHLAEGANDLRSKLLFAFLEVPPEVGKACQFLNKLTLFRRFGFDQLVPLVAVFHRGKIAAFLKDFEQPFPLLASFFLPTIVRLDLNSLLSAPSPSCI